MSINLFWDNSNIWLVGQQVCKMREPGYEFDFRIHVKNLFDFAVDSRTVDYAYVGGSIPPNSDPLWNYFSKLDIKVEKQERGQTSGGEIAVDESIQLQMANRILDSEAPSHMLLLTGDGSGYLNGKGFIKQLERALKHGWSIEVVSWDKGCNRHLKEFAEARGIYRSLESVYDKVTFVNNQRWAK
ncbi:MULTISPECIES: NYN domain-containing protein [Hymenobacter]|uniref:NYN domain-containing protein n=1 Tax=Hymenobacter negativus TaxID=2795026 RepID=A0ABS0QCL7_9BACT|nr:MULTISPECIES: NYN domain-containing protein [Hymenobacter]MBH8560436.1 NYN domain-containing protein [Hymenobacter negativus]